jgi:hypothetical protein
MKPMSEDVKDILTESAAGALGLVFGTNLFIGTEPPEPDAAVTLYDTGGHDPDIQNDLYQPTLQVKGRGGNYLAAYATMRAVMAYLTAERNITVGGTRYLAFWPVGDINALGRDEKNRALFTLNFRTMRTE